MPTSPRVRPILDADVPDVAHFLHEQLNPKVTTGEWEQLMRPPWEVDAPNRGFLLESDAGIAGVYLAVYSERTVAGDRVKVCNLAAFCVLEDARAHGLRLVRPLLRQEGYLFTDLSPSGNVVALNERLGFRPFDTATHLTVNLPAVRRRGVRLSEDAAAIARVLTGTDAQIHRDHRDAAAAHPLLVQRDDRYAYLVYRRDRRRGLPVFATPLYVGGDAALLRDAWPAVRARLLRHGLLATLAEHRVLGFTPRAGHALIRPRVKMLRGEGWSPDAVDYLYSELALVNW